MEILGKVGQRIVYYLKIDKNTIYQGDLPESNWSIVIYSDDSDKEMIDEVIRKCLNNNVLYISSIGRQCEIIEEIADDNILLMDLNDRLDDKRHPVTTSHNNIDEGLRYATAVANHSQLEINEVVIIDMIEENMYDNLVEQINNISIA